MANKRLFGRITKSSHYQLIKKSGRIIRASKWLFANIKFNDENKLNIGWTVPSYVGNSVKRNQFKRWIKEFLKSLSVDGENPLKSLDINIVLLKDSPLFYKQLNHKAFDEALSKLFGKISEYSRKQS